MAMRLKLRRDCVWRLASTASLIAVSCCATAPGTELQTFKAAIAAIHATGDPVLDDLASAERAQRNAVLLAGRMPVGDPAGCAAPQPAPGGARYIAALCPRDIEYYATNADPPATRAMRRAIDILDRYASVLLDLANGTNAAGDSTQIEQLISNVAQTAEAAGAVSGVAAPVSAAVSALDVALRDALKQAAIMEARRLITASDVPLANLIAALRAATGPMSQTLLEPTRVALGDRGLSPREVDALIGRLNGYKAVIANYDSVLREASEAWRDVVRANASSVHPTLADTAGRAAQFKADVDAASKALSALRTGAATH